MIVKGRHQHHDYEGNITIVLTITKITQPYWTVHEYIIKLDFTIWLVFVNPLCTLQRDKSITTTTHDASVSY